MATNKKNDPNILDVDGYYNLTVPDRCKVDDWLAHLGGKPNRTKTLILDRLAKKVTAIEYLFEYDNKKDYTKNKIIGELQNIYYYEEEPPTWAY